MATEKSSKRRAPSTSSEPGPAVLKFEFATQSACRVEFAFVVQMKTEELSVTCSVKDEHFSAYLETYRTSHSFYRNVVAAGLVEMATTYCPTGELRIDSITSRVTRSEITGRAMRKLVVAALSELFGAAAIPTTPRTAR